MLVRDQQAERAAWAAWVLLFLVTSAIIVVDSTRSVVINYRLAAFDWINGRSLYNFSGVGGFVYLPQSALLSLPLAVLPAGAGEVLWRLANIGCFAFGLRRFAALSAAGRRDLFPLMTLVSLPLVWDCGRNGQATLGMTGLMLLAVADIAAARWRRASAWLCLSLVLKPISLPLVLLVAAVERPMRGRLAAALAVTAAVPFLFQRPAYVLDQYAGFLRNSSLAAHVGAAMQGWAHPFSALRVAGVLVPETVQTAVRAAAALGTLALCWTGRRLDPVRSAVWLFSFSAVYILLFSPRTENNTYMMLAPALGLFLASSFLAGNRPRDGAPLAVLVLAMAGGRLIQRLLAPQAEAIWLSPLLATAFAVYLLVRFAGELQQRNAREQRA